MAKRGIKQYPEGAKYTADVFHRSYTQAELLDYRRKLAKVANQRMVRLERGESLMTGKNLTYGAYDVAKDYLKSAGRNRFSEVRKYGGNTNDLRMEIVALESFLNAKSSTVKGFHDVEIKRIQWAAGELCLKNKNWRRMSVEEQQRVKDFYDLMQSETYKKLAGTFSSESINESYTQVAKSGASHDDIMEALEQFRAAGGRKFRDLASGLNALIIE